MTEPTASVIIGTRNAAHTLERCLASIHDQTYPAVEAVVADSGSTDDTLRIARRFSAKVVKGGHERSEQRNLGAAAASGSRLFFVDSDMTLDPTLVAAGVAALAHAQSVVVPIRDVGPGFWNRVRGFERSLYMGEPGIEAPHLYRRDVFEAVGGFDPELVAGEDWDLADRVRAVTKRLPARIAVGLTHYEGRVTLTGTFRKRIYYGRNFSRYLAKRRQTPGADRPVWLRTTYLKHWPELLRHPVLTVGMVILKSVEAVGMLVGMRRARRSSVR